MCTAAIERPRLNEELPTFQFNLITDEGEILARAHSIPLRWDGTIADLPASAFDPVTGRCLYSHLDRRSFDMPPDWR